MTVDPGRIRALLDVLAEETSQLRGLAALRPEELLGGPNLMAAVKYRFIVAIEICIDVGQHLVAAEGLRAPADFADTFAALGDPADPAGRSRPIPGRDRAPGLLTGTSSGPAARAGPPSRFGPWRPASRMGAVRP
ncbi:MAG: DUF86 domain-containing protein [Actinobacteria bacterium]|nr:DUF86 domain-containing protein [Actinomycetota bacterium]